MVTGRPRKDGLRHPNGDLVQAVPPTPQVIRNRELVVGADKANDKRAGYPIGILALRGAITAADHQAAMRYVALHHAVWGSRTPKSHLAELVAGITGTASADDPAREKRLIEAAGQLGEAEAALKKLSTSRPYHVLQNLGVYENPMRFMDTSRARPPSAWAADQRDLEALQEATDALATLWGIGKSNERKAS